ncbi:sensor histidine kinase [Nocardiopsis alba]|uniref:sensor histidine kinase n=1 Tax=Nocardiopsis alba TaxID=53437 RepID=UPI003D7547DD
MSRRRAGRLEWRFARITLKARLILAVLCLTSVGLLAFGAVGTVLLQRSLVEEIDHRLSELSRAASEGRPSPQGSERMPPLPTELRRIVLDPDGEVVRSLGQTEADPGSPDVANTDPAELRERGGEPFTLPDLSGEGAWRVLVVEHDDGTLDLHAQSLDGVDSTLRQLVLIEMVLGIVVLVVLGAAAVVTVRRQLRPLHRIEATAQRIAAGDFDRRVPRGDSATETGRLAVALNTMLEELSRALRDRDRSVETTKRFVADASHELRTPLSSIRGFAELYRQGRERGVVEEDPRTERWMSRIEGEALRMSRMVDDLLMLSRFDEEPVLERTAVDLVEVADQAVRSARARDGERSVELRAPEPVRVSGDTARLAQVLGNLLNNAITHTEEGTPVRVEVTRAAVPPAPPGAVRAGRPREETCAENVGEVAVVRVIDRGPGIPEQELPRIFGRFYQVGGTGRGRGSGLGLAISASFVAAHEGYLMVESTPGRGTVFSVVLPLR